MLATAIPEETKSARGDRDHVAHEASPGGESAMALIDRCSSVEHASCGARKLWEPEWLLVPPDNDGGDVDRDDDDDELFFLFLFCP